ncbi:MAG TPA: 16S rRNA (cytosine(1402)-N(4))-methyltransferase RsmH [Candidatus Krumholzibacteria bacterium]|nr:16S rRNA (cytosine(1402)-N(4))-methyltransferase RsmH [Candidatus Krumholzibacteria bacterium]HPD72777.1 16S rRNA (cytosine(1402)-N(4))-methyltransferase RsmH [Candidatus Krumholzibacteria bacterium]HRY40291.1 16S rRNA (cytosine(1402)-N(4))-methyltransferase RsmH [Candidatus Krumholzibacteria bacterium]
MTHRPHVPVLRDEILGLLAPGPGRRYVDGTFGFGGHAESLLEAGADVLGLDLDEEAVVACRRISTDRPRLHCQRRSFRDLAGALTAVGWPPVDGLLLDLGVSSRQLDEPAKGFSYRADGPLDLRFNQDEGRPAHALLAETDETELARILRDFGEERGARALARAIQAAERTEPLRTTAQLAAVVRDALPDGAPLSAILSRVFQALRIVVNDELGALRDVLAQSLTQVAPGGRVAVVAYHSLEDRLVKQWLDRERRDCLCPPEVLDCRCGHRARLRPLTRRPVTASALEIRGNPRARSARLRAAEILPAVPGRSAS